MATALKPIDHEARLSLVDHLDELRSRLVICVVTLLLAFAFCFWQNDAVLDIVTKPVESTQNLDAPSTDTQDPLEQSARFQKEQGQALRALAPALAQVATVARTLAAGDGTSAAERRAPCRATPSASS
jgi:sec-independent protein translocase protein TatC